MKLSIENNPECFPNSLIEAFADTLITFINSTNCTENIYQQISGNASTTTVYSNNGTTTTANIENSINKTNIILVRK